MHIKIQLTNLERTEDVRNGQSDQLLIIGALKLLS